MEAFRSIFGSKLAERLKRRLVIASGVHWEIKKLRPNVSVHFQAATLLRYFNVDMVVDVGANTGQFAEGLFDFGYTGRIVSFEPVKEAHELLQARALRYKGWDVYRRCALGSEKLHTSINVSRGTVFSSLLNIEAAHGEIKPASVVVESQPVDVLTLDAIVDELGIKPQRTLLKIDTQGYEQQVIEGAERLIDQGLVGIKTEMPLFPIYKETRWLFDDICQFMRAKGFSLYAVNAEGVDPVSGRTNTLDGIFFRRQALSARPEAL